MGLKEVGMVKCEVEFDGDAMYVNGWLVYNIGDEWEIGKNDVYKNFIYRDEAVKYCMEN